MSENKIAQNHLKAAENLELAANHQREAAKLHQAGKHEAAAHQAHVANGYLAFATQYATEAAKIHAVDHTHTDHAVAPA